MLQKFVGITLNIIGKLSTLVISIPATYAVAGQVLTDFFGVRESWTLTVLCIAAVVGVEYVLLSNWYKLIVDKQAPMEIKFKNTIWALVMYIAMLGIAILHGDGLAGWIFRLSLLLALLDDAGDSLIWAWKKATEKSERNISNHWRVKLHSL